MLPRSAAAVGGIARVGALVKQIDNASLRGLRYGEVNLVIDPVAALVSGTLSEQPLP